MPRFVFVNKMDRENANYDATLDALKAKFGPKIAPVYLPIGSADSFTGYIDVIEEHANVYEGGTHRRCRSRPRWRASSTPGATRWWRRPPRRATS
jgi:elongation factor G